MRRWPPKRARWGLLLVLPLALLASGCSTRQVVVRVARYSVSDTPLPPTQQVFRCRIGASPRTLDPSLAIDVAGADVLVNLFQGLTAPGPHGHIRPGIARSWAVGDHGLRWVFHLRRSARWSNGQPVTAADFVWSWQREVNPATAAQYAESLDMIRNASAIVNGKLPPKALGVHAEGPHTLVVDLVQPTPFLLADLMNDEFMPLYPPAIERWGYAWTTPPHLVSDGAFYLKTDIINGHMTLLKNPYFWDASAVRLRKVIMYPIHNPASALDRYLAGDIDYSAQPGFPASDITLLRQELGAQVVVAPYFGTAYLTMLVHQQPFDNRDLRLAMALAVERRVLAAKLYRGLRLPAYSLMPALQGYVQQMPAWAHWPRAKRLAEARRLYAAAGYGPGHELHVKLLYPIRGTAERHVMEALVWMWHHNLGAQVGLWTEQWKVFLQDVRYDNAKLYLSAWIGNYLDPNTFLRHFQTGYVMNYADFDYPPYERLLAQAQNMQGGTARMAVFEHAERVLNAQEPIVPLYFYTASSLVKPYVRGWYPNLADLHPAQYIELMQHTRH